MLSLISATKPGESFNAELVKVDAVAHLTSVKKEESSDTEVTKEYSFIAKFLSQEPENREMIKCVGYHTREFSVYSEVVPELNKHWNQHSVNKDTDYSLHVPEFIYGICNPKEYVLIMENCKTNGFETNDKHDGLDFQQTLHAVNHIARLHALSYSYNQSSNLIEKFPAVAFSRNLSMLFKPVVLAALENVIKFVKSLPDKQEMGKKLEKGRQTLPVKYSHYWDEQSSHKILCLTHGDFWNSNLLYRYSSVAVDGKRNIEDVKLIDWQISQWGNPIFDLHYLLNTSTTANLRNNHLDDILHHYFHTFTTITERLQTTVPEWTYESFLAEYKRTALVGFMMGICLIQGTLSKAGEKLNPNSINPADNNNRYKSVKSAVYKMKSMCAKAIVPLILKPSFQFMLKYPMKKMFDPIGAELLEGHNSTMNNRLKELLEEADKSGLLDDLSK